MKESINPLYTKPHYSTKLWRAYKLYLNHYYGKTLFDEVCEEIGVSQNYLNRDDNWVSNDFTKKFMEILIRKTGDKDIARKVGQYSISPDVVNNLEFSILKLLSPLLFFKLFKFNAGKLNRFHDINIPVSKMGFIVLEMKTKGDQESDIHVYHNTAGFVEAAKDLYKLDKLTVRYVVAKDSNGRQTANYEISYSGNSWLIGKFYNVSFVFIALFLIYYSSNSYLESLLKFSNYLPALITLLLGVLGGVGFVITKLSSITKYLTFYYKQEREKSQDLYNSSIKLERRYQEAQLLKRLSSELIGCLDPRQVIEKCLTSMNEQFKYNKVAVFLLSKERHRLYLSNGIGFDNLQLDVSKIEFAYPNPDKTDGFVATVLETGKTILIQDMVLYKSKLKLPNQKLIETLGVGSMIISPILSGNEKFGTIMVIKNQVEEPLTDQDRFLVENISSQLSLYFESATNYENEKKLRHIFQKYVPRTVLEQIGTSLHTSDGALRPQKKEICSVFMDLRGFTAACDNLSPEKAFDLINLFANFTTKILSDEGAIIDNIIGDEIVSFFSRRDDDPTSHIIASLRTAIRIKSEFAQLDKIFLQNGIPSLRLGIGLHVGEASVGSVGGDAKMNFTAIGTTVNKAARLQSLTKKYEAEIVCIIASKTLLDRIIHNHGIKFESEILRGTSEVTEFAVLTKENLELIVCIIQPKTFEVA